MLDGGQLLMGLAFGAAGAALGAGIALLATRQRPENRRRTAALFAFAGLGLAVGIGQAIFPPPTAAEQIARDIDGQALFRVAFANEPALRGAVIERLRLAHESGGQEGYLKESEAVGFELSRRYFPLVVSRASPEALDQFLDFALAMIGDRYERAPDVCYAYLSGGGAAAGGLADLPVTVQRQAQDAMDAVVASAEKRPAMLSDAERQDAVARLNGIVAELMNGPDRLSLYVADYARDPATTPETRKGACLFALRLHQAMKAVPQPQRAALLRVAMGPP